MGSKLRRDRNARYLPSLVNTGFASRNRGSVTATVRPSAGQVSTIRHRFAGAGST
jgi:hypothetical protein